MGFRLFSLNPLTLHPGKPTMFRPFQRGGVLATTRHWKTCLLRRGAAADFPMKNGDFPISYVKLPEGRFGWILHIYYTYIYIYILYIFLDGHGWMDNIIYIHLIIDIISD